ncbi:hypothetical protein FNJ47_48125, partial [Bradyrhizobium sp. UFLA 03-164]|nr:hypothetical protein [Bradyrhizobium uaiense]
PPAPAQPPALPPPRSGCATAFMVVFGLVLLLPGLCALLFGIGLAHGCWSTSGFAMPAVPRIQVCGWPTRSRLRRSTPPAGR